jgi:hypothetical protein
MRDSRRWRKQNDGVLLNWVGGRLTHGLGADSAGGPRVENLKACPSHAGGCEGRDSVVAKRCLEWEEPDWQGSRHNSHVLALVNIVRAQPAELSLSVASTLLTATRVKSKIE